jgi:hypothetical protein
MWNCGLETEFTFWLQLTELTLPVSDILTYQHNTDMLCEYRVYERSEEYTKGETLAKIFEAPSLNCFSRSLNALPQYAFCHSLNAFTWFHNFMILLRILRKIIQLVGEVLSILEWWKFPFLRICKEIKLKRFYFHHQVSVSFSHIIKKIASKQLPNDSLAYVITFHTPSPRQIKNVIYWSYEIGDGAAGIK